MLKNLLAWKPKTKQTTLLAGIGAGMCIASLSWLGVETQALWLMAPFGATMVILFGLPSSPLAQPRNIVAGHVLTAAVGLITSELLGVHDWSLGLAVGLSVMLMIQTDTLHPPAGANPLLIMLSTENWHFLITPVATGALSIVGFGYLYHRHITGVSYPEKWL